MIQITTLYPKKIMEKSIGIDVGVNIKRTYMKTKNHISFTVLPLFDDHPAKE